MPRLLSEHETQKLLKRFLPMARARAVISERGLQTSAKHFPAVIKLISDKFTHKSDIGGVIFARSREELLKAYKKLLDIAKKRKIRKYNIVLQEFIEGKQVIIGLKKDPTFGHVIMLGIGGIFAEQIRDVVFRKCPITAQDAGQMINDLKYKSILQGIRGTQRINLHFLESVLMRVSKIPIKFKKILELDINPIILNSKGGKVVDARIVVE